MSIPCGKRPSVHCSLSLHPSPLSCACGMLLVTCIAAFRAQSVKKKVKGEALPAGSFRGELGAEMGQWVEYP